MNIDDFRALIRDQGKKLYRDMPWRRTPTPYFVLVSELMLQQTQVDRVVPKFNDFIRQFPNIAVLAKAPLADVLVAWSGLGYNRRAKYLHEAARKIMRDFAGELPATYDDLLLLPGVGPNTAGAILVYGSNRPAVFIETNIRTVYFYHFFADATAVHDKELRIIVEDTLDVNQPRQWYWALMDYGSYLKQTGAGHINKSVHYQKQSPLKGSLRETRGKIVRSLAGGNKSRRELGEVVGVDERFAVALDALVREGLVSQVKNQFHLTK